jgi:hypothetical protein
MRSDGAGDDGFRWRPETGKTKLAAIEASMGRFLWGCDRGRRGGAAGGLGMARGGLSWRFDGEEVRHRGVSSFACCIHLGEEGKGGGKWRRWCVVVGLIQG